MKRFIILLIVIQFFTFACLAQDKINWIKDYAAASAIARESGKPMLVDFWAEWCGPCRVMEKTFWPREDVIAESRKFVMVSLHFEKDATIAQKFQASGLPHIIFADPWGNVIARQRGYGGGSDNVVFSKMKSMPADFMPVRAWLAILAADKQDKAALEGLGHFYNDVRAYDLSTVYYKRRLEIAELESNADDTEAYLMLIAGNIFKSQDLAAAQKIYEDIIERFPQGKMAPRAFVGLITCQAYRKKLDEAEKTLSLLKNRFPNSAVIAEAELPIKTIKSLKK